MLRDKTLNVIGWVLLLLTYVSLGLHCYHQSLEITVAKSDKELLQTRYDLLGSEHAHVMRLLAHVDDELDLLHCRVYEQKYIEGQQ